MTCNCLLRSGGRLKSSNLLQYIFVSPETYCYTNYFNSQSQLHVPKFNISNSKSITSNSRGAD